MPIPGEALIAVEDLAGTGGLVVAADGSPPGALVAEVGHLQYDRLLTGGSTVLRWITLTGWRSRPAVDITDSPYPSSHGDRPGTMFAQGVTVTYDCLLHGTPASKIDALDELDRHTPVDGVEHQLVVDDGSGPSYRWARVIDLDYQQGVAFRPGPVPITIAFKCADPRRYSLSSQTVRLDVPSSTGGLDYTPGLDYAPGLGYGTTESGVGSAANGGNVETPMKARMVGPLTNPTIRLGDRVFRFAIGLTAGETLTVNGRTGEVLLNDLTDRFQSLTDDSDLLDDFSIPPGESTAALLVAAGTGYATLSWQDARM